MLVILSDLHLSDGTCGATVSPGALELFARRLRETAETASWRADGTYRPIERIDIVLLGDILDLLHSVRWASMSDVRPWGNPHNPEFFDQVSRITGDVLQANDEALSWLRGLAAEGGVTVPPAIRTGRPAQDAEGAPVSMRIHYMVGNHDWFYHLRDPRFTPLRQKIARQMGLANPAEQPFPHDFAESEELLQVMRRHRVCARHGDIFDPVSFDGDRGAGSLGDVLVLDLVNRFAAEIEGPLAQELPAATVAALGEIDDVRPLLLVAVWMDGLLERTCPSPAMRRRVKHVWDRLVEEVVSLDFVRQHDTWGRPEMLDGLRGALEFRKRPSAGWAGSVLEWLNQLRGAAGGSYAHHALAEQDFRNRRAKHIVYGHTHAAETVPLDASYAEGYVLNQVYFNAGTWRRIHSPTRLAPAEREFIASDVMTYLAFYQGDERKGRPYELWSGSLGFSPSETTVYRIDPGRASHATGQSVSTPSLHTHAPHFPAPSVKPGFLPGRRV